MANRVRGFALGLACVVVAGGVLGLPTPSLFAQSLQDTIFEGLKKRSIITTPSAPDDPKAKEQRQFIDGLRKRSIAIEPREPVGADERAKIAVIAKEKPAIDLQIFFDYNSAELGSRAQPTLVALGNVLAKPEFKGTVFLINGHTDARGSAEYNQQLSERRAAAVRRALIDQFKLAPDTLIAAGFGKEQLKLTNKPFAGENRRVEVVNTEQK